MTCTWDRLVVAEREKPTEFRWGLHCCHKHYRPQDTTVRLISFPRVTMQDTAASLLLSMISSVVLCEFYASTHGIGSYRRYLTKP